MTQSAPRRLVIFGASNIVSDLFDIGSFSRIQPGANLGGLSQIGRGVTIAIGATLLERLEIGNGAFVGAGAVATADVPAGVLVLGIPAKFKKTL